MQQTRIYFGPPGTGKTHRLMECVSAELKSGISPQEIALVSFSRRAAREARARAASELDLDKDDMIHWSTLHSAAARQMGVRPGDLMTQEAWDELGGYLALDFSSFDEDGRLSTLKRDKGHVLQYIYSIARAKQIPLEEVRLRLARERVSRVEARRFELTLDEFKAHRGLLDFPDLLDQAPGRLPVKVVLIDEAQDLTPAQWDYAERLKAEAARVYIAGDDDQAIFEWAGADVRRFLDQRGERVILDRSVRLTPEVAEVAKKIAGRIRVRQPKEWAPADRRGRVVRVSPSLGRVDPREGDWLLLARTNYLTRPYRDLCRSRGVPYYLHGVSSIDAEEARAIRAWETWRAGRDVSSDDLDLAVSRTFHQRLPDRDHAKIWSQALSRIPPARRGYYEACLRNNKRALVDEPRVTISTIHGSKGAEADNVALMRDLSPKSLRGDPEHRVWYVGATRARENLHLINSNHPLEYKI